MLFSRFNAVLAAAVLLAGTRLANADTFVWKAYVDSNWDTATANWDNSTTPATNVPWINANPSHIAQLDSTAATPGTITIVPTATSAIDVAQIDVLGTGDWTLATGNLTRAGGGTLTTNIATGDTLNLNAVITNAGATGSTGATSVSLAVTGGGTLSINVPQTFTGSGLQGISVSGGSTLKFNSQSSAGTQNSVLGNYGNGIYLNDGTLVFADATTGTNGQNRIVIGPNGGTVSAQGSTVSLGASASTPTGSIVEVTPGSSGDVTFSGTGGIRVTGTIGISGDVINSSGTTYLYTNNAYRNLIINGGTISLRNGGTKTLIPTTANVTLNAGAISFEGTASTQSINDLSGAAGTSINLGASGSLTVAGTGTTIYAGVFSSTTQLIKTTGGNLTLSGPSTTTGAFTISGGTITAGAAGTIGTNGPLGRGNIVVNGGTLTSNVANVNTGGDFNLSSGTIDPNTQSAVGSFTLNTNKNFTMSGGTLALNIASAASFDQIIERSGANTSAFTISDGTIDLGLGTANSALYNNSYQIFQNFGGANSVSNLTFTNYDSTDWTASLSNTGLLSFAPATSVPEPASLILLAMGAAALLTRRKK